MNHYLYTVEATRLGMLLHPTDEEKTILAEHRAYIQQLVAEQVAVFAGELTQRDSQHFGIVVFQAEDDASAKTILQADPAVSERMMRGCLYPHRVSLWNSHAMTLSEGQQHYFYRIRPVRPAMLSEGPTEQEGSAMGQHFMYLKGLVEEGIFAYAGPTLNTDNSNFGAGLLRANSLDNAWQIGNNDPAVINRVMRLDIFEFTVFRFNPDFAI